MALYQVVAIHQVRPQSLWFCCHISDTNLRVFSPSQGLKLFALTAKGSFELRKAIDRCIYIFKVLCHYCIGVRKIKLNKRRVSSQLSVRFRKEKTLGISDYFQYLYQFLHPEETWRFYTYFRIMDSKPFFAKFFFTAGAFKSLKVELNDWYMSITKI